MMECPHCHQQLSAVACVPDEQRLTLSIEFEGPHLAAKTLGGMLTDTAELLRLIAKDAGANVQVLIEAMSFGEGKATTTFVIVAKKP